MPLTDLPTKRHAARAPSATTLAPWLPAAAVLLAAGWGSNQFTPMLLVYRHTLGLDTGTLEALFGAYALGLIPGLLLAGPWSDARGRRAVVVPAAALSLVADSTLIAGSQAVALLFVGRLLTGVGSGAAFGAGTAWLRESARPPAGTASHATAARRAAIAMTAGFGLGPLVAGLLAQWAPSPAVTPYLPHLAFTAVVLVLLRGAAETGGGPGRAVRLRWTGVRNARFRRVVAPMAPWVFAAPAIAFALLPSVVGADHAAHGIALTAVITSVTALAGVVIQPLARRLEAHAQRNRAGITGLLVVAAGLGLGAAAVGTDEMVLLMPTAVVLGCAYGLCLVAGLSEVQLLAEDGGLGSLTAAYYALTYLGFAAPYLLALAAHLAGYDLLLTISAALALSTAALVARQSTRPTSSENSPTYRPTG